MAHRPSFVTMVWRFVCAQLPVGNGIPAYCGNNSIEADEQCDDGGFSRRDDDCMRQPAAVGSNRKPMRLG